MGFALVRLTVVKGMTPDIDVSEEEIQRAFEAKLSVIEDGLEHVGSFVGTGRGEIDTLALDDERRVVVIEFKKPGASDQEALVQAMDYAVWCTANREWLEKYVRKQKPNLLEQEVGISEDVRIVVVAADYEERVKNAAWAIEFGVSLYSYSFIPHEKDPEEIRIVPRLVLDTSLPTSRSVRTPKTEEDHLRGYDHLRAAYTKLKERILAIDPSITINPSPQDYIGFFARKLFAAVHFKRRWIRLDLWNQVEHKRYTNNSPENEWGYTHIQSAEDVDEIVQEWLRTAYKRAS